MVNTAAAIPNIHNMKAPINTMIRMAQNFNLSKSHFFLVETCQKIAKKNGEKPISFLYYF
jgi:hypothetical protein